MVWAPVLPANTHLAPGGMHLSIYRPMKAAPFEDKDVTLLSHLLPHLRAAFETRHALRASELQAALGRHALAALETGILIVDADGQILLMNESTQRLVLDSGVLTFTRGRLATRTDVGRAALHGFLANLFQPAKAGKPHPRTLRIARSGKLAPFQLRGQPISEDGKQWPQIPRPAAVLFLRDPQAAMQQHDESVAQQFGLSPTESWVTASLARGRTLQQLASERGVSRETLRTHLKNIFDKTGCRRQADLIALVLAVQTA